VTTDSPSPRQLREELAQRGITDERVLDAIQETPREQFVPEPLQDAAYEDSALPIGDGQTISQPYIVALMTQELNLTGVEHVLEIGTGSGYQAAILSRLAGKVITIERLPALAASARWVLTELGITNVEFVIGDGTLGSPERGPYDRIMVTACAPDIPKPLYEQLKAGGRLVAPIGNDEQQDLVLVEKTDDGPKTTFLCGCRFVKLIGEAGWPQMETPTG
jgi:protein-L-isoaspartate(D-aspartate) O-methyltransferase